MHTYLIAYQTPTRTTGSCILAFTEKIMPKDLTKVATAVQNARKSPEVIMILAFSKFED